MTQNTAIIIGLVILVLALVAGVARRDKFPGGRVILVFLLLVIAAAAALLVALLVS